MHNKVKKSLLLVITVLFCTAVGFAQSKFSFVFMSDVHYTRKFEAPKKFQMLVDTLNRLNPDLVMSGGDMVYDALRASEKDVLSNTTAFLKAASQIKAPIHYAIGNHEVFNLYQKAADTGSILYGKRYYEKYFGKRYYSFDHKGWHFMVLDNIYITADRKYIGKVDSIQLEWIKEDLKNVSTETPIVIMTHVPFITTLSQWYGGGTNANDDKVAAVDSHRVLKLFESKKVRLILQGHLHYFEALNILDKTLVITAPAVSGKWWQGKQHGIENGFIKINVEGDKVDYEYIGVNMNNER